MRSASVSGGLRPGTSLTRSTPRRCRSAVFFGLIGGHAREHTRVDGRRYRPGTQKPTVGGPTAGRTRGAPAARTGSAVAQRRGHDRSPGTPAPSRRNETRRQRRGFAALSPGPPTPAPLPTAPCRADRLSGAQLDSKQQRCGSWYSPLADTSALLGGAVWRPDPGAVGTGSFLQAGGVP
jgi:hypothetical protein